MLLLLCSLLLSLDPKLRCPGFAPPAWYAPVLCAQNVISVLFVTFPQLTVCSLSLSAIPLAVCVLYILLLVNYFRLKRMLGILA